MGERAVLVEQLDDDPAAWSRGVRALALAGVVDVVPAAATVLITCASEAALDAVASRLDDVDAVPAGVGTASIVIPTRYDGADLDAVAAATGLAVEDVVAVHSGATYEVAFCGFAPGFAYLRGLDRRLHLPRRPTPRARVPAGSVAIAAEYSAVYPRSSPGGWHLIGTTDAVTFDVTWERGRSSPALLAPGDRVRFEPA
jgi:KipI family sensor histidine kinase inhibitor